MVNSYEIPEDKKEASRTVDQKTGDFDLEKIDKNIEAVNDRAEDLEHQEREDALTKIREFEKRTGINTDKTEGEIEAAMFHDGSKINIENSDEVIRVVERVKKELLNHIQNPEYLKKLIIEFDGNSPKAEEAQKRRARILNNVKVTIIPLEEMKRRFSSIVTGEFAGLYDSDKNEIILPSDAYGDYMDNIAFHELSHASTLGDYHITDRASELLDDSYERGGLLGIYRYDKDELDDIYFSKPTERLARKQELDRELEKLGIKKYGEEFTDEHYEEMMKYYNEGKFPWNVNHFIKRTKPADFKRIFNEIAKNEDSPDLSVAA